MFIITKLFTYNYLELVLVNTKLFIANPEGGCERWISEVN